MDSCHLFNFLFGTKKTTTELSKCFASVIGEDGPSKRSRSARRHRNSPSDAKDNSYPHASRCARADAPPSPLKQLQTRLINTFTPKKTAERRRSFSCDAKCGTYRANLVESVNSDDDEECDRLDEVVDGGIYQSKSNLNDDVTRSGPQNCTKNSDESTSPLKDSTCTESSINPHSGRNIEGSASESLVQSEINRGCNTNSTKQSYDLQRCRRIIMYDYESDNKLGNNEPQSTIQTEDLNTVRREAADDEELEPITIDLTPSGDNHHPNQQEGKEARKSSDNSIINSNVTDKRSAFVRSLVQSIESNGGFVPPNCEYSLDDGTKLEGNCNGIVEDWSSNASSKVATRRNPSKPITFVKPLPPKTPPKTNRARFLSIQLGLNKPVKIQQLFQDDKFLARLFDKLDPLDRCVAAQVCRAWRRVLYSNQNYWKDLINVIDCTQLRREQLVECIMNTLQSAKMKQNYHKTTDTMNQRPLKQHRSNWRLDQSQEWSVNNMGTQLVNSNTDINQRYSATPPHCNDRFFDFDQEDVWRIQELCNRFTHRQSYQNHRSISTHRQLNDPSSNNYQQTTNEQQQAHMTTKSSSIPSQISSTFSSVSLSSLLSPLSESNRIESIKEKLYTSLDDRGFDAICLFGATDDDIDDLVCKIPLGAHKRIRVGRLSNSSISNHGLGVFISTFSELEEIELSGCNEITNSLDLKSLSNLRRLIITDCINIADGIAQNLISIIEQLEELTIQAYHLTDAFIEYLSLNSDTTKLTRLELSNCKEITNQTLITITKRFSQLQMLSISGSTKICDDGIEILAEQVCHLRCLDLSWCSRITDASLECIACDLGESLTDLVLDRNVHITDNGLGYLATMSGLTLLHIRWCPRISDIGLESVLKVKSLRYLSLAGIHQVTARSLLCLVDTDLVEVELTNCPAVNNDLLLFLSSRMPKCNIIY